MRATTRTWMTGIAAVAMIAAATGCTGGSDAAPLTTVSPTAPATAETPPATEATTTTTSTTTTTTPPPTTLDRDTIKADVEAGLRAYSTTFGSATYDLDSPTAGSAALKFVVEGGDVEERSTLVINQYLAAGQRVRPNPEIPNRIDVFDIELVDETTAVIDYCDINSDIVYEPNGLGDGVELIVNDDVFVDRARMTLKFDGIWKVLEGETVERYEGATACPAN